MSFSEETGHYVGVGNTEKERLLDADLQDVMDDMTMDHLAVMAEYMQAMADPGRTFEPGDDPHDDPRFVAARTKLGRLMIWQGWSPASYYTGKVRGA